jgi:tetratricopeptide (TPR) repeat protein
MATALACAIALGDVLNAIPVYAVSEAFDRGCQQMQRKLFREAVGSFSESISNDNRDANSYFRRGQCFLCLKDLPSALEDFDRAIALTEGNDQYYLWRGTAYAQMGKDEPAINDYRRAFRINPGLIDNYKKYAAEQLPSVAATSAMHDAHDDRTISVGSGANSTKDFVEAIRRSSEQSSGYFRPGAIYTGIYSKGPDGKQVVVYPIGRAELQPTKAKKEYYVVLNPKHDIEQQILALDAVPEDASKYFERALDYQQLNQKQQAKEDFNRALSIKPDNVTYLLARAYFLHQTGNDEDAQKDIGHARDIDPSLPSTIDFKGPDGEQVKK